MDYPTYSKSSIAHTAQFNFCCGEISPQGYKSKNNTTSYYYHYLLSLGHSSYYFFIISAGTDTDSGLLGWLVLVPVFCSMQWYMPQEKKRKYNSFSWTWHQAGCCAAGGVVYKRGQWRETNGHAYSSGTEKIHKVFNIALRIGNKQFSRLAKQRAFNLFLFFACKPGCWWWGEGESVHICLQTPSPRTPWDMFFMEL